MGGGREDRVLQATFASAPMAAEPPAVGRGVGGGGAALVGETGRGAMGCGEASVGAAMRAEQRKLAGDARKRRQ